MSLAIFTFSHFGISHFAFRISNFPFRISHFPFLWQNLGGNEYCRAITQVKRHA